MTQQPPDDETSRGPSTPQGRPTHPPPGFPPPASPPPGAYPPPASYPTYPAYPPPAWRPEPPVGPPSGPRRTRVVLAVVTAVVLLTTAVVVPLVLTTGDDGDDLQAREPTAAGEEGSAPASEDLSEVVVYEDLPTTHVTETVLYEQLPPVGGSHFGEWLECGAYDEPVQDENAVHDLEHGAVWITYDPSLGADEVAALEAALPQNGIMSPYDGLPAPVVVTVWERQLALTGADDPRLALFVEEFSDGVTAPEPMASCAGGTASGTPA